MICWKRFWAEILQKMALPIVGAYEKYCSVHFPPCIGFFRPFCTGLIAGNYDMLEEIPRWNPPKNGTIHRRRIRIILFCTFSVLYRFFSSLLYGPHSRKLWYVGRGSTLISSEKWHFPLDKYTRNIFLYIFRAVSEFSFLLHKSCSRKLWYVGSGFMPGPPKYDTFQWKGILGIFFCTFSGQFRNLRSFCTSLVAGNYDMLEVVSCGTPLKMVLPSGRAY